jgi:hypothetical protein
MNKIRFHSIYFEILFNSYRLLVLIEYSSKWFKYSNTMKNITENPQNISELLKAKVESFQVEELDARLEMRSWVREILDEIPIPGL